MPTPSQMKAAQDVSPVTCVIAGPGTGKSTCIEERVPWLLGRGVNPDSIFVVSYTVAASGDLRYRIRQECAKRGLGPEGQSIQVSTLHSLALKMLRKAQLLAHFPVDPMVMDDWEQEHVFDAEFAHECSIPPTRAEETREAYEASWNTLNDRHLQPILPPQQTAFLAFHSAFKQTYSCMLPGEMVKECLDHIRAGTVDPIALTEATNMVVDEFQDLNQCDQSFVQAFQTGGAILFVAGDDDQSLYLFRHAAPDGIVNFSVTYPNAIIHVLPKCFRCTPAILTPALTLVSRNAPRFPKQPTSVYSDKQPPLPGHFEVWHFQTGDVEASAIANSCRELISAGMPANDIIVLIASKDTQSPIIEKALLSVGVSFESPRGKALSESTEGRLLLSMFRILSNDDDYLALRSLLGLFPGMGPARCGHIREVLAANNLNFKDLFALPVPAQIFTPIESNAITQVAAARTLLRNWDIGDTIGTRNTDVVNLLTTFLPAESPLLASTIAMWQNEVVSRLPNDATLAELLEYLQAEREAEQERLLERIYARLQMASTSTPQPERVRIMTYHGSKGLSADVVFLPGLETNILPNKWALRSPGLFAEQRRLLYVGITRARLACFASYSTTRTGGQAKRLAKRWSVKMAPSKFVTELGVKAVPREEGLSMSEALRLVTETESL